MAPVEQLSARRTFPRRPRYPKKSWTDTPKREDMKAARSGAICLVIDHLARGAGDIMRYGVVLTNKAAIVCWERIEPIAMRYWRGEVEADAALFATAELMDRTVKDYGLGELIELPPAWPARLDRAPVGRQAGAAPRVEELRSL